MTHFSRLSLLVVLLIALLTAASTDISYAQDPSPTPTLVPTDTATWTPTPIPTDTATWTPTATDVPTSTSTATDAPTATPTETATATATDAPTLADTPTETATSTATLAEITPEVTETVAPSETVTEATIISPETTDTVSESATPIYEVIELPFSERQSVENQILLTRPSEVGALSQVQMAQSLQAGPFSYIEDFEDDTSDFAFNLGGTQSVSGYGVLDPGSVSSTTSPSLETRGAVARSNVPSASNFYYMALQVNLFFDQPYTVEAVDVQPGYYIYQTHIAPIRHRLILAFFDSNSAPIGNYVICEYDIDVSQQVNYVLNDTNVTCDLNFTAVEEVSAVAIVHDVPYYSPLGVVYDLSLDNITLQLSAPPIDIVVDTADVASPDLDALCSLKEAILSINGEGGSDCNRVPNPELGQNNRIRFAQGMSNISLSAVAEQSAFGPSGLPVIRNNIIIEGPISIDRLGTAPEFRIFQVDTEVNLTLDHVIVQGGSVTGNGGGIYNQGTLTLNNSAVIGNYAEGNGGGIYQIGTGQLFIENSLIQDNVARGQGASIYHAGTGPASVTSTCFVDNWGLTDNSSIFAAATSSTLGAIGNWWGMASGAFGVGAGQGDSVRGNINASMPLTSSPDGKFCGTSMVILAGSWSGNQQGAIYTGAYNVGDALSTLTVSLTDHPIDAFRRVMVDASGKVQIEFKLEGASTSCTTNDADEIEPASLVARITCGSGNIFTEFTAVHELGHVFIDRTNNQFFNLMGTARLLDGGDKGDIVFGKTSWVDADNNTRNGDWYRGQRGWGSGAPYFDIDDPTVIQLGPCGIPATKNPTSFQQNPCHAKDWLVDSSISTIELEEAAADMFLNWVYKTLDIGDSEGNTAFQNVDWRFGTHPVDPTNPGDIRFDWMNQNQNLPTIFAIQGW